MLHRSNLLVAAALVFLLIVLCGCAAMHQESHHDAGLLQRDHECIATQNAPQENNDVAIIASRPLEEQFTAPSLAWPRTYEFASSAEEQNFNAVNLLFWMVFVVGLFMVVRNR